MEQLLINIKHRFKFLWKLIEQLNDWLFDRLYNKQLNRSINLYLEDVKFDEYQFRRLFPEDIGTLSEMIERLPPEDLRYFKPHGFDIDALQQQHKKKAFLMMGTFDNDKLIGYFFLRFFMNRTCFVGRVIDNNYRGKGIGNSMNKVMYHLSWSMGFRCLSTVSKDNKAVMKAHKRNGSLVILKELDNNYLLIEFKQDMEAVNA